MVMTDNWSDATALAAAVRTGEVTPVGSPCRIPSPARSIPGTAGSVTGVCAAGSSSSSGVCSIGIPAGTTGGGAIVACDHRIFNTFPRD